MGPDELCPRGWRELANITVRPLSFLKDCGDQGKSLMSGNVKPISKTRPNDLRNYRLISLPFMPKKVKEQIHLDHISEHVKEQRRLGTVSMD